MKSVHDIIGPRFTKPTLRNIWHNIPLTLSAIALMSLAKIMSTPMEVVVFLCLPALVASSFVRDAYDVLHSKATFYSLPISLLISSVLLYLFIQTHFDTVEAQLQTFCGDAYTIVSRILCGMLYLLSAFFCTFLINWMLTYSDDGQRELFARVLHGKVMNGIIVCCIVITVILFVIFSFDPYFWHDESFTLRLVSLSYANGIDITAHDVHPPLYYLMLKTWLSIFSFGTHNVTAIVVLSRLFSFLAYVLTAILCWKKLAGSGISLWRRLLLLCFGASFALVWYGTEIRMYSWGLFFVTATYLFSRDVILGHGGEKKLANLAYHHIFFSLCRIYPQFRSHLGLGDMAYPISPANYPRQTDNN